MPYQWLTLRIGEERDRRAREAQILGMLPGAIEDLQAQLSTCVEAFNSAFGSDLARLERTPQGMSLEGNGPPVKIATDTELPGFRVERDGSVLAIKVGVLPGDRLFYFDVAGDQYLTMEELTRRILDRLLFPKLSE